VGIKFSRLSLVKAQSVTDREKSITTKAVNRNNSKLSAVKGNIDYKVSINIGGSSKKIIFIFDISFWYFGDESQHFCI
jgi:hypothetical protein